MTKIAAIIVAAGRGTRAGGDLPKQWVPLAGRSSVEHCLARFSTHPEISETCLVIHPEDEGRAAPLKLKTVVGGAERSHSVRAGLQSLAANPPDYVLIHDAARPCLSHALISDVIAALKDNAAAAPGIPVVDTLWRGENHLVSGQADRTALFRAQTPQGFDYAALVAAYDAINETTGDDVELARRAGLDVRIVPGDEANFKITHPEDFTRAEKILGRAMDFRIGNGFDVHAFEAGDHVVLCGVKVPHDKALKGHSDADVAMHALTDAIYGALAEGDIGRHFPPSEAKWKGADSAIFLSHACELAASMGFSISNLDLTIICERPKITPVAGEMIASLAKITGLDAGRISVKATTTEQRGFTGREEGIAAMATVALVSA